MTILNVTPFPTIKTERLILRELLVSDQEQIFSLRTNTEVIKYIDRPISRNDKNGLAFIERISNSTKNKDIFYWVITLKGSSKLIGSICLWNFSVDKTIVEVGYELFPEYFRKGFMNEALTAVLDFGFNVTCFKTIEAFTHKDNLGSKKLLVKNGFKEDKARVDDDNLNNIIFIKTND